MQPPGWQEARSERAEPSGGQTPWGAGGAQDVAPERRFTEEIGRYEDFLRSTIDWLWETDAGLTLSYASSPVALKLGIPAQVLVGRALTALGRFEHSHPGSNAYPSSTDKKFMYSNPVIWIISSGESNELKAFQLEPEIVEIPIVIS